MTDALVSFAWIAGAGLLAPVLSFLTGKRVPAVVFLLVLGLVIGPFGVGLASDGEAVDLLRELGLGFLFLLAGLEINPSMLKSREGGNALATWILCLVLSFVGAVLLTSGQTDVAVVLAIALSSTALGTLMPILKQNGLTGTPVGNSVTIHGAIGELAPVIAMAVLLSARTTWASAVVLAVFFVVAAVVAVLPRTVHRLVPAVGWALRDGAGSTNQTVIRSVVLMLAILMAVAAVFDLDVVLGAFATGIILHQIVPDKLLPPLESQLEVVGYGVFIPVFFVTSGMAVDTGVIADHPWFVLAVVPVILLTRGMPIFLRELWTPTGSALTTWRQKLEMSLYSATGLPIIVAVTGVATSSGILDQDDASLLVAGGALTVLIFPLVAPLVGEKSPEGTQEETQ